MASYKVVPTNIRNGNTAPYFMIEAPNKHEAEKEARREFNDRSSLSRYSNWSPEIEKL